jgi:hypothetical protein
VKRPCGRKLRNCEETDTQKLEVERKKEKNEKADGRREEKV